MVVEGGCSRFDILISMFFSGTDFAIEEGMKEKTMKTKTLTIQISDRWARIFQWLVLSMLIMSMQMLFGDPPPVQVW